MKRKRKPNICKAFNKWQKLNAKGWRHWMRESWGTKLSIQWKRENICKIKLFNQHIYCRIAAHDGQTQVYFNSIIFLSLTTWLIKIVICKFTLFFVQSSYIRWQSQRMAPFTYKKYSFILIITPQRWFTKYSLKVTKQSKYRFSELICIVHFKELRKRRK